MSTFVFIVAFCIVAVLVYMARYSGRLRVAETRIIAAPIAEVYTQIVDFCCWSAWSPWLEHDPDAQVTLSDKTDGEQSRYAWDGTRGGSGEIMHVSIRAPNRIEQRLRIRQPFRIRGRAYWQLADCAGKTEVTWGMNGRVAFSLRAFAQTVQGMMMLDFRYGLDRLARVLEPVDAPCYSLSYLGIREIPASRYVYKTYSGSLKGLSDALRLGFAELRQQLVDLGGDPSGAPIAVYVKTNIKWRTTVCHMGIPTASADFDRLPVRELPAHSAYVLRLEGNVAALEVAWYQAMQRMRIENLQPDQRIAPFERYLGAPSAASGVVTELHVPVRR